MIHTDNAQATLAEALMSCCGVTDAQEGTMHENAGAQNKGNRTPIGRRENLHERGNIEVEGDVGALGKKTFDLKKSHDQGDEDIMGLGFANYTLFLGNKLYTSYLGLLRVSVGYQCAEMMFC